MVEKSTPTEDVVETPQDKQALDTAEKKKKTNFSMVNIEPGTILEFKKIIQLLVRWLMTLKLNLEMVLFV